jgi:hypothetical protein
VSCCWRLPFCCSAALAAVEQPCGTAEACSKTCCRPGVQRDAG